MCNALNIEPVITTTESSTPESFADLVEYCWGNESTKMGAKRAADGHPDTYRVKYWELGNEQCGDKLATSPSLAPARIALSVNVAVQYPTTDDTCHAGMVRWWPLGCYALPGPSNCRQHQLRRAGDCDGE